VFVCVVWPAATRGFGLFEFAVSNPLIDARIEARVWGATNWAEALETVHGFAAVAASAAVDTPAMMADNRTQIGHLLFPPIELWVG
jgi:hypothetical protein